MKKYLNIDISNSRPQSSQSTYTLPTTRPTSSLAPSPPKLEQCHPRPATSMAHHRSVSSSTFSSTKSSAVITLKPMRSETEPMIAPPNEQSAARPPSKRRVNMLPPTIVPQRGQQVPSGPQVPLRLPMSIGQPETKVAMRPPEAASSKVATQILRPEATQRPAPPLKQYGGPLRVEATIKERLLGGAQRVLLPDVQQPPVPLGPLLASEDKKASADVHAVQAVAGWLAHHTYRKGCHSPLTCSSRLNSVRHGPKSSAAMDAKRAVTPVSTVSSTVPKRPGPSHHPLVGEKKEVPILAREGKKARFGGKGKEVSSKVSSVGVRGKNEVQKAGPSVPDHPKSSMSTRLVSQDGPEAKTRKTDDLKRAHPAVEKALQSAKGGAPPRTHNPKKVVVRTGGVTQPTLSQLARMKVADEERERRLAAKASTKPLTIRPKGKAVPPKAISKEAKIPAAAIATPLPPSPEVRPIDVPLPPSPVSAPLVAVGGEPEQVAVPSAKDPENSIAAVNGCPPMPTPTQVHPFKMATASKTPISALVSSIQRGFLMSPNSPLSPVQPDAEWECPAWPGLALSVGEEPSFEGVAESTVKRLLETIGNDLDRKALVDMN